MSRLCLLAGICVVVSGAGCSSDGGGGTTDIRPDLAEEVGTPRGASAGLSFSSGGGALESANFTLVLSLGPRMPTGSAASANFRIDFGPHSVQP